MADKNKLYYGDNLDILQRYVPDESVDLVYLDPPFNSNASYNVLFKDHQGAESPSQIKAFEDTWRWDKHAARAYQDTVEAGGKLSEALQAFRNLVGDSDMLAYLSMMAPRLQELRRVLKPTGSIYLHCDPTASHYLKLLMDAVFGPENFRNEIVWKRRYGAFSTVHGSNKFGNSTDSLMFYAKSQAQRLTPQYSFDDPSYRQYLEKMFKYVDENGRKYRIADLANPARRPNLIYEYKGYKPPANGWAISREKMEQWDKEGRLHFPKSKEGRIQRKRFLDEVKGKPVQNLWDDIRMVASQSAERLDYPTQKPLALLERIIKASSNEGDLVLDTFCGCGTTIDAAQKLGRRWIGIDITHLAINLIKHRLQDTYGEEINDTYEVIGEPTSVPDARVLAQQDPYQFQWWALGLVGARQAEGKKGADKGIDGRLYFHDDPGGKTKQVIFSVKAGKTNVSHVRDLRGVVERENAEIGVLISMHPNTKPMRAEAVAAGTYESSWGKHPKIQLLTVSELLEGKRIDIPQLTGGNLTYRKAKKRDPDNGQQLELREQHEDYE